jgi:hypothetical protein
MDFVAMEMKPDNGGGSPVVAGRGEEGREEPRKWVDSV